MGNVFGAMIENDAAVDFLLLITSLNFRAFILLLCCLIILKFMKGSAANRHVFISVAMLATFLLPLVSNIAPAIDIVFEIPSSIINSATLINNEHINTSTIASSSVNDSQDFSFVAWSFSNAQYLLFTLAISYALISAMIILKVIFSNVRVCLTTICAKPCYQDNWCTIISFHRIRFWMASNIELRHSPHIRSPMTWGLIRPVILIPTAALDWEEELIRSTVLHELAHIKRRDWLTQQFAWCVCAVYWINPLTWKTLDYLHCSAETAADDMALSSGMKKTHYAENLLNVAKGICQFKYSNYASLSITGKNSELSNRIAAILNPNGIHTPVSGKPLFLSIALILCFLLPLTSIQANYRQKVNSQGAAFAELSEYRIRNSSLQPDQTPQVNAPPDEAEFPPITLDVQTQTSGNTSEVNTKPNFETPSYDTESLVSIDKLKQIKESTMNDALIHLDEPSMIVDITGAEAFKIASAKFIHALQSVNEQTLVSTADATPPKTVQAEKVKYVNNLEVTTPKQPNDNDHQNAWLTLVQQMTSHNQEINTNHKQHEDRIVTASLKPRNLVTPRYPTIARQRGIEGEVTVQFDVDAKGKVLEATVIAASPGGIFDRHVIRALEKSEYQPKIIDGKAVSVKGIQEIYRFVLES